MGALTAVSFRQRLEARHRVYLERGRRERNEIGGWMCLKRGHGTTAEQERAVGDRQGVGQEGGAR